MIGPRNWGVPNWEIEIEYLVPTGTRELLYLAWQFLRRNHEYRAFWIEKNEPSIDDDGYWIDETGEERHPWEEATSQFGLAIPHNPTLNMGAYFIGSGSRELRHSVSNNGVCNTSISASEIGFIFDMTLPLEGQFKRALESAKSLQSYRKEQGVLQFKNTKVRLNKYMSYLRVLDADDAGALENKIEETLFPSLTNEHPDYRRRAALRDSRKAARRLRDQDYRLLVNAWAASSEK
jgi:hypothetical protein